VNPARALAPRIARLVEMSKRATAGPTLVRATVAAAAFASLLIAYPPGVLNAWAPFAFAVVALLPALFSRGPLPTTVMLVAVLGWLGSGSDFAVKDSTFTRMCALAALLYLIHIGSALAAVMPYDAIITNGVFGPWLVRGVIVLSLTGVLALFTIDLPRFVLGHREVIASIGGLLVTLAITGYLTLLGRRRPER
jgi:hypothetical protein